MVITGTKSEELAEIAAKYYSKILRQIFTGKKLKMSEFKVHNVVATSDFNIPISLEGLSAEHV